MALVIALVGGTAVYSAVKLVAPLRLTPEEEFDGADLAIHKISASPESDW
jgi:Amt family ammonium transporter